MAAYNIYEAKTKFSALVEKAESGEESIISRSGKPVARLIPFAEHASGKNKAKPVRNTFGANFGTWGDMGKALDEPLDEETLRAFGMQD